MNRPRIPVIPKAVAAAVFLILVAGGCSGIRNDYPEKNTFRLAAPPATPVSVTHPAVPLLVKQLGISPAFESDAFVYQTGQNRFRSDFYHSFLVPPARMITDIVKENLYASGRFRPASPAAQAKNRYQLWGKIIDLYADLRGGEPFKAVIAIRLILDADTGDGFTPVLQKTYRQEIPFDTLAPDLYIDSLNEGLARILDAFYADIDAAKLKEDAI